MQSETPDELIHCEVYSQRFGFVVDTVRSCTTSYHVHHGVCDRVVHRGLLGDANQDVCASFRSSRDACYSPKQRLAHYRLVLGCIRFYPPLRKTRLRQALVRARSLYADTMVARSYAETNFCALPSLRYQPGPTGRQRSV